MGTFPLILSFYSRLFLVIAASFAHSCLNHGNTVGRHMTVCTPLRMAGRHIYQGVYPSGRLGGGYTRVYLRMLGGGYTRFIPGLRA